MSRPATRLEVANRIIANLKIIAEVRAKGG